uniref:tRNA (guanine-N(7)-)-methyltransferase n=1 Tax=Latimeria chalumnae TaxID=7897 RepID=H3BFC1_LATCH
AALPQKRYYRQRAHSNPMADHTLDYPIHCVDMRFCKRKPIISFRIRQVATEISQLKCIYVIIIAGLKSICHFRLLLVTESLRTFLNSIIKNLRPEDGWSLETVASLRPCFQEYLGSVFPPTQLSKMFFLFPDPHFKKTKHKWRIISSMLLAEYAYVLRLGGLVYTITDVDEVHDWMVKHFTEHPLFERVSLEELKSDIILDRLGTCTEEGKKVLRNGGKNFTAVFRRVEDR